MLLQKQEGGRRYKDSPASCVLARQASWLQKSYSTHLEIIADFSSSVKKEGRGPCLWAVAETLTPGCVLGIGWIMVSVWIWIGCITVQQHYWKKMGAEAIERNE